MTNPLRSQTNWQIPRELPDLRRVGTIALDTETNDEGLRADRGSAWPWRGGYICGISVAWRDDSGIRGNYFPLRHPDSQNFDRENVARWLKDHIAAGVKFTTQNGLYDWGWLRADLGVAMPPSDQLEEIGALATLIDENLLQLQPRRTVRAGTDCPARTRHCWRRQSRPPASRSARRTRYNRTFGKCRRVMSAATPRQIRSPRWGYLRASIPILDREGTRAAYRLDVDLLPMVHEMRRRGIRVDQSAAEQARDYCLQKRDSRAHRAVGAAWQPREHGRNRVAKMESANL